MDLSKVWPTLQEKGTQIGLQLLGAVILWIAGRWLIGIITRLTSAGMTRQKFDTTLIHYIVATLTGLLNVILIISIFGVLGVQTTSFAALLAAIGLAIGTAWSGLLANFAAGVFMIILRPFRVGDFISAGGTVGTVTEIGPFATRINTPDNIMTIVGNNKILADNIQNFTHNPFRRVDLTAQLNHDSDVPAVIATLSERLSRIPNVISEPSPEVTLLEFTAAGPKLAVRPYCHNDHYWQVYFDTNALLRELGGELGLSVPATHMVVRQA
jgi:small conductance mechanosensitive channel